MASFSLIIEIRVMLIEKCRKKHQVVKRGILWESLSKLKISFSKKMGEPASERRSKGQTKVEPFLSLEDQIWSHHNFNASNSSSHLFFFMHI